MNAPALSAPPPPQKSTNGRIQIATLRAALRAVDRLSPARAAALTFTLWCTPRRHRRPEREVEVLQEARPFRFRGPGGRSLCGWSWGEGPAVLLVHGWEGRGTQLGAFVAPLVAQGFRVVAFDGPAHGDSEGRRVTVFELAEAARGAAEFAGGIHGVIAHSFGALATALAIGDGLEARRVALVAPSLGPGASMPMLQDLFGLSDTAISLLQARIARRAGLPWHQVETGAPYRQLTARTLVVHDTDDKEVDVHEGELIAARTGARLVITRGLGHRRVLRDEAVVDEVTRFFASGASDARAAWDPWRGFLYGDFEAAPAS